MPQLPLKLFHCRVLPVFAGFLRALVRKVHPQLRPGPADSAGSSIGNLWLEFPVPISQRVNEATAKVISNLRAVRATINAEIRCSVCGSLWKVRKNEQSANSNWQLA
jgi:hypothetical protein